MQNQRNNFIVVIMAGGEGKRFGNGKVKVLQPVFGRPMLVHLIETVQELKPTKILVVVGRHKELIHATISNFVADSANVVYVTQDVPQGTGHALQCCIPELEKESDSKTLILSGDTPMIQIDTIRNILNMESDVTLVVRDTDRNKQLGAGRVVLLEGSFVKIVEEVDASPLERDITIVNTGIYCIRARLLLDNLPLLEPNNAQNELYLTDVIRLIKCNSGKDISCYNIPKERWYEVIGVNTPEDLTYLITCRENAVTLTKNE